MKKVLWGLLILLLLIAAIGIYMLNMSGDSVSDKEADHTLSAMALYSEYSSNEDASNKKYIGNTIEIMGTISELSKDQEGASVIMFTEPGNMEGVMCTLDKSQNNKALKVGQSVKVKAQCTGKLDMTGVVLNKGILIE